MADIVWRPDGQQIRPPLKEGDVYRPDILKVIERKIDSLSPALRELSIDIHGKPLPLPR